METKLYEELNKSEKRERQKEISKVFFKLGILAFGGPAAHIAMMDSELIKYYVEAHGSRVKFVHPDDG